jgi:putative transposase
MPEYCRSHAAGGVCFFPVVTYNHLPNLTTDESRVLLRSAWIDMQGRFPFTTTAVCPLPDHLHCIWSLPEGDAGFSVRWKEIKRLFTKSYLVQVGPGVQRNKSRSKRGEVAVWQRFFLGAYDPGSARSQPAHGLPSLQSGETRISGESGRLALVELSSLCENGVL